MFKHKKRLCPELTDVSSLTLRSELELLADGQALTDVTKSNDDYQFQAGEEARMNEVGGLVIVSKQICGNEMPPYFVNVNERLGLNKE